MKRTLIVSGSLLAIAAVFGIGAAPTAATVVCDRYADPSGNDSAAGTSTAPFRTAQKLANSLAAGQTGCLSGAFTEDLKIYNSGVTLTSLPGQRGTLKGRLWIPDAANDVTVSNLFLDGRSASNLPSPTVNGDRASFLNNEVTNFHTTICFSLGLTPEEGPYGIARDTLIEGNRIHGCGRLPATNHDHGIYIESSRNAVIRNNFIYDNADRGVQLYPDAQGTLIENNVIDGVGEGILFAGGDGLTGIGAYASSDNIVRRNIISNNTVRWLVESNWVAGQPVGHNNQVYENCLWATNSTSYYNSNNGVDTEAPLGFTASNNKTAKPQYVDRASKDFRLQADSPCAGYGPGGSATEASAPPAPPAPAPKPPVSTAAPTLSGAARVSQKLTAHAGAWSGATPTTFGYRWQRCDKNGVNCSATANTTRTYALKLADAGFTFRVVVTAENAAGTTPASSRQSALVVARKGHKGSRSLEHRRVTRVALRRFASRLRH